jgi:hypothetical protein
MSGARFLSCRRFSQPDTAPAARGRCSLTDQFQTGALKCRNQLHQGIDIATDNTIACLHALHGRHRKAAEVGQLTLIDPQQSTGGAQLGSCYHTSIRSGPINMHVYTISYDVSSISFNGYCGLQHVSQRRQLPRVTARRPGGGAIVPQRDLRNSQRFILEITWADGNVPSYSPA